MQDRNRVSKSGRGEFNTEGFYAALDAERAARGIAWKDVAQQSGVAASTLSRMAGGKRPDVDGLACLLAWSGLNAAAFIPRSQAGKRPDTMAEITAFLRADKNLRPESAKALEQIIRTAYEGFRER